MSLAQDELSVPFVPFDHLYRLSDGTGLFEHAELIAPRLEHGYCVDDVARGLLVAVREPNPSERLIRLTDLYLDFVVDAQVGDGRFHNRRRVDRRWMDEPSLADCWGRALWGLGSAVARAPRLGLRALAHFRLGAANRSPWPRAMAFAALGAAEVLRVRPADGPARALLADAAAMIGGLGDRRRSWPEPRLTYANAILPETLLAAGSLLGDRAAHRAGLAMLEWLLEVETTGDHLSVSPVGGWAPGEPRPGFDQQPIEVAALADACARAFDDTADPHWLVGLRRAAAWFVGENDANVMMIDVVSGGGCDGLERDGRNENQGAESTLAMISTFQQARRLLSPPS